MIAETTRIARNNVTYFGDISKFIWNTVHDKPSVACVDPFSRFGKTPACDGRTPDRSTYRTAYASRGKN